MYINGAYKRLKFIVDLISMEIQYNMLFIKVDSLYTTYICV